MSHKLQNFLLFVRTLNATLQEDSWEQLESELGGSSIPTGTDIDAAPDIHSIRGNPKASDSSASAPSGSSPRPHGAHNGYNARSNSPHTSIAQISGTASALRIHPSTFINNFLLQSKPDAWIAITNDGDWISVLKLDDLSLPASDEILARITTAYEISDADGVAYLTPKDPLRRATVATTNIEDQFVQLIPTVQTGGEYSPASTSFNSNAFVDSSNSKTISRSTSFSSRNSNTTTLWSARSPSRSSNATSLWSRDEDSTPHNKGTSFFQNAKNVHISGGKFTQVQGNYAVFDQSRHTSNVNSFNTTNKRNIHNAYNNHSKEYGVLPPKTGPRLNRHHRQTGPQDAQALWEEEEEDDIFSTSQNSQSSGMPGDPGKHSPPGDPRYANNQYGQYGGGLDDSQHGAASSMRPPYMYTPASNRSNVQYTAGQVQNTSADLQQSFAAMMQPVKQQTVPDPEVEDMAALPFSRSSF
ncbi:hypothetical protein BDZ97DRAFT_1766370 [Flammula alnicola]|nr:hypothetical protein BDZ97DRAFT_1766370 [Flammula alnicola]